MKTKINHDRTLVDLNDVISGKVKDYNIPQYLRFNDLILLAEHAVRVYGLTKSTQKLSFDSICVYTHKFILTPFGRRMLINLANKKYI